MIHHHEKNNESRIVRARAIATHLGNRKSGLRLWESIDSRRVRRGRGDWLLFTLSGVEDGAFVARQRGLEVEVSDQVIFESVKINALHCDEGH